MVTEITMEETKLIIKTVETLDRKYYGLRHLKKKCL